MLRSLGLLETRPLPPTSSTIALYVTSKSICSGTPVPIPTKPLLHTTHQRDFTLGILPSYLISMHFTPPFPADSRTTPCWHSYRYPYSCSMERLDARPRRASLCPPPARYRPHHERCPPTHTHTHTHTHTQPSRLPSLTQIPSTTSFTPPAPTTPTHPPPGPRDVHAASPHYPRSNMMPWP